MWLVKKLGEEDEREKNGGNLWRERKETSWRPNSFSSSIWEKRFWFCFVLFETKTQKRKSAVMAIWNGSSPTKEGCCIECKRDEKYSLLFGRWEWSTIFASTDLLSLLLWPDHFSLAFFSLNIQQLFYKFFRYSPLHIGCFLSKKESCYWNHRLKFKKKGRKKNANPLHTAGWTLNCVVRIDLDF